MKLTGSAYSLWLAWRIGHGRRPDLETEIAKPTTFLGGIGLLRINPKGWAMTLSPGASFVALADGPVRLALLLNTILALASTISLVAWGAAGLVLARTLRANVHWRVMNMTLGLLLVASIILIWLGSFLSALNVHFGLSC